MNQVKFKHGEIIEVIGNVGSGKSTLTKKITKNSNLKYFDVDLFESNPFLSDVVQDRKRWAFTTGLFFSFKRSETIENLISTLINNSVILDQGYDMGIKIYSKNNFKDNQMTAEEWELLSQIHSRLTSHLPKISTTIYIDTPTDKILKRIKERGRVHEKSYTREYIENLKQRLDEYINEIKSNRDSIIIWNPVNKTINYIGKADNRFDIFLK